MYWWHKHQVYSLRIMVTEYSTNKLRNKEWGGGGGGGRSDSEEVGS